MNDKAGNQIGLPTFLDGVSVHPALQGVPLTRSSDMEKPLLIAVAYTKVFNLSEPEDVQEFSRIKTLCKNQQAEMLHLQREFVEEDKSFLVLAEWCTYELKPNPKQVRVYE